MAKKPRVLISNRQRRYRVSLRRLAWQAREILCRLGHGTGEVGLLLVGEARMRRLNRECLGKDRPTDVLAFPLGEEGEAPHGLLGDVVICMPVAWRQARAQGHTLQREVTVLLVHGLLHLAGYDHERGETEARRMRRTERKLLESLGVSRS